jgi:hypothetical protein
LPDELVESLAAEDRAYSADRARVTIAMAASLFSFWAILPFLSVKNWSLLLGFYGLLALAILASWRVMRTGHTGLLMTLVLITALDLAFSRLLGPFVLMPIVVCAALTTVFTRPEFYGRMWLMLGWTTVAIMGPVALEWLRVVPTTSTLVPGMLVIRSDTFSIRGSWVDELALILANVFYVGAVGMVTYKLNERRVRAQRQLHVQAWHFKQLLPTRRAGSDITKA